MECPDSLSHYTSTVTKLAGCLCAPSEAVLKLAAHAFMTKTKWARFGHKLGTDNFKGFARDLS